MFIKNVINALLTATSAIKVSASVLEIGTGQATSVAEVAARLTAITGGPEPELGVLPDRANDVNLVMDADATARVIGWRAKVSLDEGLLRTVDWYRSERAAGLR